MGMGRLVPWGMKLLDATVLMYCRVVLLRKLGDFERNDEVYDAIEENEKAIEDAVKGER